MDSLHTFTDFGQISQTDANDAFGPLTDRQFRITSRFSSTGNVKAYAAVSGIIFAQISDTNKINLILKPLNTHLINFTPVKFFIYRGLKKDDFLNSSNIELRSKVGASPFIQGLYAKFEDIQSKLGLNPADPIPSKIIGIDSQNGNDLLESYFYITNPDIQLPVVKQGVELGNYVGGTSGIGFEIILEEGLYQPQLTYARKDDFTIAIPSSITDLTSFQARELKEEILNFVDPAAYYGMYYEEGIVRPGATVSVYTDVIEKFKNANRVYIDIRNENGLSLNFYQNYSTGTGSDLNKQFQAGSTLNSLAKTEYAKLGWPIFYIEAPSTTSQNFNVIVLALKKADNQNPMLFAESGNIISGTHNKKFVLDLNLLGSDPVWTLPITFSFPNHTAGSQKLNIANHIKLYYFRQSEPVTWPAGVLPYNNYFDNILGPVNLQPYWGTNENINWISDQDFIFRAVDENKQLMDRGIVFEGENSTGRVLFYATLIEDVEKGSEQSASSIKGGTSSQNRFLEVIFAKSFILNFDTRKIDPNTSVNILSFKRLFKTGISTFTAKEVEVALPTRGSGLIALGISASEHTQLKMLTIGFSTVHPITIFFENKTALVDIDGKSYQTYTITLKGLDQVGSIKAESTTIKVFTLDDLTFVSADFSELTPLPSVYTRNYEEAIGALRKNPYSTDKTIWEDHFIAKDTAGSLSGAPDTMKVIVESFIRDIGQISYDAVAKSNIISKINTYGSKLLARARAYVKYVEPDDRILYWSRLKMGVALKSHPLLLQKPDDRNELIQLFEEKTRGYTTVDFSSAGSKKKILVTGFDPFFLNPKISWQNVNQSNPSGAVALSIHGETLDNGFVQTMIMPVRWADFDSSSGEQSGVGYGIVEKYIAPYIGVADMIITVSQSLEGDYHIDRFATVNRGGTVDNMWHKRIANSNSAPLTAAEASKYLWIESTLPKAMIAEYDASDTAPDIWKHYAIYAQNYELAEKVTDIPDTLYEMDPDIPFQNFRPRNYNGIKGSLKKSTVLTKSDRVIKGSGGNYLSNEIFYRVALARSKWVEANTPLGGSAPEFPTGHFHIAKLQEGNDLSDPYYRFGGSTMLELNQLIQTVKDRIKKGVKYIGDLL